MDTDIDIKKGENMFFVGEDEVNPIAYISFKMDDDDDFIVDSTQVSDQLSGQGVGSKLVTIMVDYAEQEGKKIVPECPFARAVMEKDEGMRNMIKE
jgi:predicted GNAT family acetyltransferase